MYLIDGYNLLYQTTLETREELLEKINQYCRLAQKTAIIVFDGYAPEDLSNDVVEVRFVGDADQGIMDIMKANNNPTELTLVSSDKELLYWARQNKIGTILAEHFNYIIPGQINSGEEQKPQEPFTDKEVKDQLKEYNYFKD